MRHRGQSMLALDAVHDAERLLPRAPARAVSDRTIIGLELHQRRNVLFEKISIAFLGFRREKLKRNHRASGLAGGGVYVAYKLDHPAIKDRLNGPASENLSPACQQR